MVKHIFKIFYSVFIFSSGFSFAQVNLVQNPSFEIHSACPTNTGGDVDKATGWDTCHQSADYFNSCGTTTFFQVPKNYFGYQNPAYGNAYCGFYTYDGSSFYREIIIGQLSIPLTVNQKYYVSFKVSRADSSFVIGYSTNKIGINMSTSKINNVPINNTATVYSNTVITDTISWTKINGSFTADSSYQYIMIGNFFDDANTTVVHDGNGNIAYYFIDEVCISTDSAFTENYTSGINNYNSESSIEIFPNPANIFFSIRNISNNPIKIFNPFGCEIKEQQSETKNNTIINCATWPQGLYFIEYKNCRYKLFINH